MVNICGSVVFIQNFLKNKKVRRANKKAENRKKALEMLDEEIEKTKICIEEKADEESVVIKKDNEKKTDR